MLGNPESTCAALRAYAERVIVVGTVLGLLQIVITIATLYALVHAAMQRSDAYIAAEKLSKPVWLVILAAAVVVPLLLNVLGAAMAACAAGLYLADVRPRLLEVQGKSR